MHSDRPTTAVIVLGAGNGLRLGRSEPKAFVHVAGRPALERAVSAVYGMRQRVQVIVTVPNSFVPMAREFLQQLPGFAGHETTVIVGGATRQQSVQRALAHLADEVEIVLVHDAARPLAPSWLFDSVAAEVAESGQGVVAALPVADTVKHVDQDDQIIATLDRSELMAAQTPQGFPRAQLQAAHDRAGGDYTDDSGLVAAIGYPVKVVAGDQLAFKITTAWELRRAEDLFVVDSGSSIRVGTGTDVHAYDDEKPLWLAGLYWPDEPGLRGHSDGDVVCHAICDAILSAARLGDLGTLFGTDDPQFAGARSEVFLRATLQHLDGLGLQLGNVAVQVIGNRPNMSARRREAESHLSSILSATVSIAATTSDALGFTGRGEGVAAIATALVHAKASGPVTGALRLQGPHS